MTNLDYPHTGYGVEVHTEETGWVMLDGIHRTRAAANKLKQSLTGQHGFTADDLRIVPLTIDLATTRKEDTE